MSYAQLKQYLKELARYKFIRRDDQLYWMTDSGRQFLHIYREMSTLLGAPIRLHNFHIKPALPSDAITGKNEVVTPAAK